MTEQLKQNRDDLSVLYKVLINIRPSTILKIMTIPEYVDAILHSEEPYTDISIYKTVLSAYKKMLVNGRGTGMSLRVVNRISREVFGNDRIWENELDKSELFFTDGLEKIDDILAIRIKNIPSFVSALRNYSSTKYTDDDVYNILKSVCIPKLMNDDLSFDELTTMNRVSRVLTGSPVAWKKERKKNGKY